MDVVESYQKGMPKQHQIFLPDRMFHVLFDRDEALGIILLGLQSLANLLHSSAKGGEGVF